jgi:hypothetical protein
MSPAPSDAQILDLAEFRLRRAARVRAASRVKQQFLWSWPNGQLLAADFPLPAASSYSSVSVKSR